jgi:acetylornithine deacetylase/succinyl-diaminopimelate desuccinylase-like protein
MAAFMTPVAYLRAHRDRFVAELAEFVRFASVSAQPDRARDVRACASWAQWQHAPGRPTLLVYGHYDVQPPDPLAEWTSPPFDPAIRGEHLYGRGAADDKGQLFIHLKAIESHLRTRGSLPVNVTCLFEGEEEIGSPHVLPFIEQQAPALVADAAVVSDTRMLGPRRPALTESLRGALSVELAVRGQAKDLHSGNYGGAVHNPLHALCEILARLHDPQGRVAIPGFYDRVGELNAEERRYMADVGPSDREILTDAGAVDGWGEDGYTLYERTTIRPALTINGVTGGYQGPGSKAVIPARASAKLNFRLVAHQDPEEIDGMFRRFVARIAPRTVRVTVRTEMRAHPVSIDREHPAMRAAAIAYRAGFDRLPVFLRTGGTIPVIHLLQQRLGVPTVMMGFALPDSALHAPNEKLHLPTFVRGIRTSIAFLTELARRGRS